MEQTGKPPCVDGRERSKIPTQYLLGKLFSCYSCGTKLHSQCLEKKQANGGFFATISASIYSGAALPAIVCQEKAETRACVWGPSSLLRPGKTKDPVMSSLGRAPRSAHQITLPPDAAKTSPFDKKKKNDAEMIKNPTAAKRSSTRSGSGSGKSHETVIWAGKPRSLAADITALSQEAFHCCSSSISC